MGTDDFPEVAKDPRWVEAINEDMQALSKNEMWDLAHLHPTKGNQMPMDIQGEAQCQRHRQSV